MILSIITSIILLSTPCKNYDAHAIKTMQLDDRTTIYLIYSENGLNEVYTAKIKVPTSTGWTYAYYEALTEYQVNSVIENPKIASKLFLYNRVRCE